MGPSVDVANVRTTLLLGMALTAVACGDDGALQEPVEVTFAALSGGEPVGCGDTLPGLDASGEDFVLRGLRFFVSDLRLDGQPVDLDDDGRWQDGSVALLDFETGGSDCLLGTPDTRDHVTGTVAADVGAGTLSFVVGVPFASNHGDVAAATGPLSLTSMFWNWQGGYKFVRLDGSANGAPYNFHLGSTGCDGGPSGGVTTCMNPNRVTVSLPDFDPATSIVVLDLDALFDGAGFVNTPDTPPGCMSAPGDPECEAVFGNLGLSYGGGAAGAQSAFVAAARTEVP